MLCCEELNGDGGVMKNNIKYLVMDVDGTLTDGKIYMGNDGEIFKAFNIKDGCGIHDILIPNGIVPVIITGRKSKILENRCRELKIEMLYQGIADKLTVLKQILDAHKSELSQVAYIGDDINDLSCMKKIKEEHGIVGCPFDAVRQVKQIADYTCDAKGGAGAVREFIEWIVD